MSVRAAVAYYQIMETAIELLAVVFAAGMAAGYAIREAMSRRHRRLARMYDVRGEGL